MRRFPPAWDPDAGQLVLVAMGALLAASSRGHAGPGALAWSAEAHERNMRLAIRAAHVSVGLGGAPIGAVVVDRAGETIADGYSLVAHRRDPTAHAETSAIRLAAARTGRFHLGDLVLYSTLEPCAMCLAASVWANLAAVVFGADSSVAPEEYYDRFDYCAVSHAEGTRRDVTRTPLPVRGHVLFEECAALLVSEEKYELLDRRDGTVDRAQIGIEVAS